MKEYSFQYTQDAKKNMQFTRTFNKATEQALRRQLQSYYFVANKIRFLNMLSIKTGTLLFYYSDTRPFSLGVSLLDKNAKLALWVKSEPIWRSNEKIKALHISKNRQKIKFAFDLADAEHAIYFPLQTLLNDLQKQSILKKPIQNPILRPNPKHAWESVSVFNPAVLLLDNKVHFIYRAIGRDGQSVFGYAASNDGIHIDERLEMPVFPIMDLQVHKHSVQKSQYASGGNCCGCEDPRLVIIDDTIYMTYTAFDGHHAPGMHLTSISVTNFLNHNWRWTESIRLSAQGEMQKNWVIFPQLMQDQYAILHSITPTVQVDYFDSLLFDRSPQIKSYYAAQNRTQVWDSWVRGVGPVPLQVKDGWLILYHAMDRKDPDRYKLGGMILDKDDPTKILYRATMPLLEPNESYENEGLKSGVLYSCGAIIKDRQLLVYYGGADTVVCMASADLDCVLHHIKQRPIEGSFYVNP